MLGKVLSVIERCPVPDEYKALEQKPWRVLALGVNSLNSRREIVESLWPDITHILSEIEGFDIKGPDDNKSWFHLRRADYFPPEANMPDELARIDILRVKKEFVELGVMEKLRNLPEKRNDVVCAGWWPCSLDNMVYPFFSFVQKLSVLKYKDKSMSYGGYIPDDSRAAKLMTDPIRPWYPHLKPWLDIIKPDELDRPYGHWFNHILGGWR